jgi:hypothetical protein
MTLLRVLFITCLTVATGLAGCAASQKQTPITEIGSGAYSITKRSGFLGLRPTELKAQLEQEALAYCGAKGMALSVLDSKAVDADPPAYPSATVQFRCVAR